jgi:hypothetical protein
MLRPGPLPGLALAIVLFGTGAGAGRQAEEPEKKFYSSADRLAAIRQATLFAPSNVSAADILAGPAQRTDQFQLRFNDSVTCEFDKPGSQKSGNTPKFDCRITKVESPDGRVQVLTAEMDEEPVKVKFRPDNREIYAEPASTRLLWALGFYADSMFPVRLTCVN